MKVLIVGSTSVIARSLADRLKSESVNVKLAGRREADFAFDLSVWDDNPTIKEHYDAVVHIAADFGGTKDHDYIRTEMVNAVGTLSACALAHRVQAKHFVLLSSIFSTYAPSDPYYGIYALSKRHSEEVAQFFCAERGMALTILRPSQVYDDAGLCRPHQELLYLIADKAQAGENLELYGSHDARRNYIHLSDLTESIHRVLKRKQLGIFTCAHPQSITLTMMARAAYCAFGTVERSEIIFLTEQKDLLDLPIINDFDLYSKIQYQPQIGIEEGYKRIKRHREIDS